MPWLRVLVKDKDHIDACGRHALRKRGIQQARGREALRDQIIRRPPDRAPPRAMATKRIPDFATLHPGYARWRIFVSVVKVRGKFRR